MPKTNNKLSPTLHPGTINPAGAHLNSSPRRLRWEPNRNYLQFKIMICSTPTKGTCALQLILVTNLPWVACLLLQISDRWAPTSLQNLLTARQTDKILLRSSRTGLKTKLAFWLTRCPNKMTRRSSSVRYAKTTSKWPLTPQQQGLILFCGFPKRRQASSEKADRTVSAI